MLGCKCVTNERGDRHVLYTQSPREREQMSEILQVTVFQASHTGRIPIYLTPSPQRSLAEFKQ